MEEKRGSIAFFGTYRPPVALDIFSSPNPAKSSKEELLLTDGESYNFNARVIPPAALKIILKRPKIAAELSTLVKESDVDLGRASGLVFVSERDSLETLHLSIRFFDEKSCPKVKVFSFSEVYGTFDGVRMEDNGCFAGADYLVYVTTKDDPDQRRQPWNAVYRTNLKTGKTDRLTPSGTADLSPSVSPSGKRVAVASFQRNGGWDGEIEDLQTDIFVMNVGGSLQRRLVIRNGGWPTWGSDDVIFFHRKDGKNWGVFRADISSGKFPISGVTRVTPDGIDAVTPAGIDATTVAVATIRKKSSFSDVRDEEQFRHIEIFYSAGGKNPVKITMNTRPKADHFNPFVIDGGKRIGYHRSKSELIKRDDEIERTFHKISSPIKDAGVFRVSGVFPTFSKDGSQLAFVDNEFKSVWLADGKGLRNVFETNGPDNVFAPVFNQDPKKDMLYVCMGPSFNAAKKLDICAIPNVSSAKKQRQKLTKSFNNAFPSTNPDGTKLVFRSTRDGGEKKHKNLYIMENAQQGEYGDGTVKRLTNGEWTDSQCQWSPSGDWIVFSSSRDKPKDAPELDNNLDPGFFAIYLVKWNDPAVVVRVAGSGSDPFLAGHVNHPFFSPDGKSIVVSADLAAVSADPISLPLFVHSVRPYGDIFTVEIDPTDIKKNKDVKRFTRVTHSRYENSTACWTMFSTKDPNAAWNLLIGEEEAYTPACPYMHGDGAESWHMTGHLVIPRRCC